MNIHLKGMTRRQLAASLACTALMPGTAQAKPLRRFASMDYGLAETLICLGCPPVALVAAQDWGRWVVEPPLPESVVNLGTSREPNLELLQSLKPDAIYILSDGKFTDGGKTVRFLETENVINDPEVGYRPRAIIHTIAFWQRDGEEAMQAIAKQHKGTYRFVPPGKK